MASSPWGSEGWEVFTQKERAEQSLKITSCAGLQGHFQWHSCLLHIFFRIWCSSRMTAMRWNTQSRWPRSCQTVRDKTVQPRERAQGDDIYISCPDTVGESHAPHDASLFLQHQKLSRLSIFWRTGLGLLSQNLPWRQLEALLSFPPGFVLPGWLDTQGCLLDPREQKATPASLVRTSSLRISKTVGLY